MKFLSGTNRIRRVTALSYVSTTVTPDVDTTDIATVTLNVATTTVAAPSGQYYNGQILALRLLQDGTGGRLITWNSIYTFQAGAPRLSKTASVMDYIEFQYNSATSKFEAIKVNIYDDATPVLFKGYATTDQTISSADTWTSVNLGGETTDTHNAHSTVSNTSRFVAPYTGQYFATGDVLWKFGFTATSLYARGAGFAVNGTDLGPTFWDLYDQSELLTCRMIDIVNLTAGDYLELRAYSQRASVDLWASSPYGSTLTVRSWFA